MGFGMETATLQNRFSLTKDGKYHDATFSVEGDTVSVLYWARQGVVRLIGKAEGSAPEQTARKLLRQLI